MTDLYIGHTDTGREYWRSIAQLLTNTQFLGASGAGKTTIMTEQADHIIWHRPDVPIVVLDGVGTLAPSIHARVLQMCDVLRDRGYDVRATEARVRYLCISPENDSGLSFDLLKLRPIAGIDGVRLETYRERVAVLTATLGHSTEGAEAFKLIQRYATAAFTLLVAAHRVPTDLPLLLSPSTGFSYMLRLLREVEQFMPADLAAAKTTRAFFDAQLQVLRELFAVYSMNPVQFNAQAQSTLRHYQWLHTDLADFFLRDTLDFGAFHDAGGSLLVESKHVDPTIAGLVRRTLYGIRHSHILARMRHTDTLAIIDEQAGMKAALYAEHLANSRNRKDHHWFGFQSEQQIGEAGQQFQELSAAMRTHVFFRAGSPEAAAQIAKRVHPMDLEATILLRKDANHSRSTQHGTQHGTQAGTQRGRQRGTQHGVQQGTRHSTGRSFDTGTSLSRRYGGEENRRIERIRDSPETAYLPVREQAAETIYSEDQLTRLYSKRDAESEGDDVSEGSSDSESASESETELQSSSDVESDVEGENAGESLREERVGIPEQLLIAARDAMQLPVASAYWQEEGQAAVLVQHKPPTVIPDLGRSWSGRRDQLVLFGRVEPVPPLDYLLIPRKEKKAPAPKTATAPGTLERKKPTRRAKVDQDGGQSA